MHNVRLRASVPGFLALALAAAAPVRGADQTFERSLGVSGPVTLSVSTGSGSITVRPGTDGGVKVVGTVRPNHGWGGGSAAEADAAVRAIVANPPVVQEGNAIRLGEIADRELARRVSVSFEVTVPPSATVTSRTGSGDVEIGDLGGAVTAQTGSGSIRVGRTGAPVQAQTGSGEVTILGARERVDVSTGSGGVVVQDVSGGATVRTGSGDIDVRQSAPGAIELSSGSGSVTARGINGAARARSASGDVRLSGTPASDWEVNSASGSVVLEIPPGTSFRIVANSSSGSITNDHPATSTQSSRRELQATIGQGGPQVTVRSASGSIEIRKR
jgi:DUF4097 and DUF4098 domain-containing protein YvlB